MKTLAIIFACMGLFPALAGIIVYYAGDNVDNEAAAILGAFALWGIAGILEALAGLCAFIHWLF